VTRVTTVWFVASGNPGTSSFLETNTVAVNFWVRTSAAGLDRDDIKRAAEDEHPEWQAKAAGTKTMFARQLALFASDIAIDDQVITFDKARRESVLVGRVVERYRYEDPAAIDDHPHVLAVEWLGVIDRLGMPDGGAAIPSTPGITVRRVYEAAVTGVVPLDDAPTSSRSEGLATRPTRSRPGTDRFEWEPVDGAHRYLLRQAFGGVSEVRSPLLVVMLNPAANHEAGFRRSTTCHAVRRWAAERGYDGAVYVNLFSHIEPNSALLRSVPHDELNGPDADRVMEEIGRLVRGPVVAGWGDLPPGLSRARYDARVAEVERLLGRDLSCLGFTRNGYPRHGRGWRADDELVPLRQ
jgi:hypothetical protein